MIKDNFKKTYLVFLILISILTYSSYGYSKVKQTKKEIIQGLYQTALTDFNNKKYDESLKTIKKVLKKNKRHYNALYLKVKCFKALKNNKKVIFAYKNIIKYHKKKVDNYYGIIEFLLEIGKPNKTKKYMKKLLRLQKKKARPLVLSARVDISRKRFKQSLKSLKKAKKFGEKC